MRGPGADVFIDIIINIDIIIDIIISRSRGGIEGGRGGRGGRARPVEARVALVLRRHGPAPAPIYSRK